MVVILGRLDLQQLVPITTKVVSSNPVYAIQHYVVKFVSDLRQVGGFVLILSTPVSSTNTNHDLEEELAFQYMVLFWE
jgi:hypothetical protein